MGMRMQSWSGKDRGEDGDGVMVQEGTRLGLQSDGDTGVGLTASELPESSRSLTVRVQDAGGGTTGRSWLSSRKKPGCHMSE